MKEKKHRKLSMYFLIALGMIALDQLTKYLAYTYLGPYQGSSYHLIGDYVKFTYVLNPGMAFGIKLDWEYGKILLTVFRLVAMFGISWYMYKMHERKAHNGLLICIALILAGATGNLVDSTIYGILDPDLLVENALFPLFHGKVIDMIHFDFHYNNMWPVFNVADSIIFIAVAIIMIRHNKFFPKVDVNDVTETEDRNESQRDTKIENSAAHEDKDVSAKSSS